MPGRHRRRARRGRPGGGGHGGERAGRAPEGPVSRAAASRGGDPPARGGSRAAAGARRDAGGRQARRAGLPGAVPSRARSPARGRRGRMRAGRSCMGATRGRRTPRVSPDRPGRVRAASRRARGGEEVPVEVHGPVMNPAGVDVGSAALLLLRRRGERLVVRRARVRPGGRRSLGRRRAEGHGRGDAAVCPTPDPGPRAAAALPEHAADLQAALADVDGRVVPERVLGRGGRRRSART